MTQKKRTKIKFHLLDFCIAKKIMYLLSIQIVSFFYIFPEVFDNI